MTTPEHVTAQTLADLHRVNLALPAALARLADMRSGYSEVASGGQRNPGRPGRRTARRRWTASDCPPM